MASGILGTAVSGLMAFQRSLDTTSHNIANVNTEGYSRQRVQSGTNIPEFSGAGYLGTGVHVTSITRSYDQFINTQLRSSTATFGEVDQYHQLAAQVDSILADPSTGMAPAIENFFNATHDVADDPSYVPARQVMLSEAENMIRRFNGVNQRFETLQTQVNSDIEVAVADINSYAQSIADLNKRIAADLSRANGEQQPNDLLDQRDTLLVKLSEIIDVSVVPQQNGMVSVFIGKGQSLVLDATASELTALASEYDPQQLDVALKTRNGDQVITQQISGGSLAGALRFRDEVLDPARQKLGQMAAGLMLEFNNVHEAGFDLDGLPGLALFDFAGDEVPITNNPKNTGNAIVTAQFQDPGDPLTPNAVKNLDFSDFELAYDGANYTLTRVRDNQTVTLTVEPTANPDVFNLTYASPSDPTVSGLPGINIAIDLTGGINSGDQFLLRPTYSAAQKIGVNIDDPRKIAGATNIEIDPVTGAPVPQLDAFGSPVLDASGNPLYVIIDGPMPGDNRNALALADLESKLSLLGGTASFHEAYDQIVSDVGTLTRKSELSAAAQQTLLTQAQESRENLVGVNLDEEAANLIKFQQSYQAAAQAISVSSGLFDTLLGAVR